METVLITSNVLIIIALFFIGIFIRKYFPAYLSKKAENLATKEDIGQITKEVESIKHEYSANLESIKASIGSKLYINQIRYQNEFNILINLSEKLVETKDAALALRPQLDLHNPNETEVEEQRRRLKDFADAALPLIRFYESRKPFYPEEIYFKISKLVELVKSEMIQYKYRDEDTATQAKEYWENASKNAIKIVDTTGFILEEIRKRAKYWEEFDLKQGDVNGHAS